MKPNVRQYKRELLDVPHDCKNSMESACSWCSHIEYEAWDKDIIVLWHQLVGSKHVQA